MKSQQNIIELVIRPGLTIPRRWSQWPRWKRWSRRKLRSDKRWSPCSSHKPQPSCQRRKTNQMRTQNRKRLWRKAERKVGKGRYYVNQGHVYCRHVKNHWFARGSNTYDHLLGDSFFFCSFLQPPCLKLWRAFYLNEHEHCYSQNFRETRTPSGGQARLFQNNVKNNWRISWMCVW